MSKGYTLIEILASITILFIAATSLLGFFTGSARAQREALATQEIVDNTSYVVEYISRALRMARKDDVGGVNCLSGTKVNYESTRSGNGIKFRNYASNCQEFFLESGRLKEWKDVDGEISENYLTSESLEVTSFTIGGVDSWDQNDDLQPKVTIFIEIKGLLDAQTGSQPTIRAQTTISQRNLDVKY